MVIALALIMMLSCIACANNAADNNANASDETPVLKVALSPDFAPMEFVDTAKEGQEQFVGFDVTLAKHIAEQLGMKLEIEPMSFDACQVAVQMGNVDLGISGFCWTAERAENYLISDYYIAGDNETKQTLIVAADKAGQYTKAEDFAGMKIGAQAASLQELLCNAALPDDGIAVPADAGIQQQLVDIPQATDLSVAAEFTFARAIILAADGHVVPGRNGDAITVFLGALALRRGLAVDHGHLHVEARVDDTIELTQALDDHSVLLLNDVAGVGDQQQQDDDGNQKAGKGGDDTGKQHGLSSDRNTLALGYPHEAATCHQQEDPWSKKAKFEYCYQFSNSVFGSKSPL